LHEIRDWLIAAGTLGGTLVALYIGVIRDWWQRPSLSLDFRHTEPSDAQVVGWQAWHGDGTPQLNPLGVQISGRSAYARVQVENKPGKRTAEDVEVLVEAVRIGAPRAGSAAPPRDSESLGDLPLAASNSEPTRSVLNIPPGVKRHFDLVHVQGPQEGDPRTGLSVRLDVHPPPADTRHVIYAASIDVDLVTTARNATAHCFTARIDYDGVWPDNEDEIWQHLRVDVKQRDG
jgi:hypothetical protein